MAKGNKGFDWTKYRLKSEPEDVTLSVEGEEFTVKVRPVGYTEKNQIVTKCMIWGENTGFDADKYVREYLKAAIVEAPWGRTNDMFLASIDQRLGSALEEIVPKAFGDKNTPASGKETVKKESDDS